jgi:hypothetical protein
MASTLITAGDASNGLVQTAGNDGTLVIQSGPAGAKVNAISIASNGTTTIQNLANSYQPCKAWVNFDGYTGTIRASYNISSVVRNAVGDYTITFTTPLVDANYAVTFGGQPNSQYLLGMQIKAGTTMTASSFTMSSGSYNTPFADNGILCVSVFR